MEDMNQKLAVRVGRFDVSNLSEATDEETVGLKTSFGNQLLNTFRSKPIIANGLIF